MPLKLLNEADVVATTHVRMGVYGRNGVGKTTFASTIDTGNVLVISVDDENIRPYLARPNIRVGKIRRWQDVIDVYDIVSNPKNRIDALVWDTWSRVQDLALGHICGYEPSDPEKLRTYIDRIPKSPQDWRGWNQIGALCSEWQRNFNLLPVHLLYLMQENDREQRYDDSVQTGPRLTPYALQGIRDSVEILGRLYVSLETAEDTPVLPTPGTEGSTHIPDDALEVRKLFIGQHERYLAKGPTDKLGRVIREPTWAKVTTPLLSSPPTPTNGLATAKSSSTSRAAVGASAPT